MKLISDDNKEGFNLSLEYIHRLYEQRDEMRKDRIGYKKRKRIFDILTNTKKKIEYEIGCMPVKKILRYIEIKELPFEFDGTAEEEKRLKERDKELEELRRKYHVGIHSKLYELMEFSSPDYALKEIKSFIPGIADVYDKFLDHISYIRLDPLKVIFNVWHKALRKDDYGDNKTIERTILEFKKNLKGTDKEYLFESLKESTDFDSLRKKSLYGLKRFYYDLAEFIYKKSFIEKITPRDYKVKLGEEEQLIRRLHSLYSLAKKAELKSLVDECKNFMNNYYSKPAKITHLRKFVSKYQDRLLEHEDELIKKTELKNFVIK